jgi:hypothetical protein
MGDFSTLNSSQPWMTHNFNSSKKNIFLNLILMKDKPHSRFQAFKLFSVHYHCCDPWHRICSARLGQFALSNKPRTMEGRFAVGLVEPWFWIFCIRLCWNPLIVFFRPGVGCHVPPISNPGASLLFATSILCRFVYSSSCLVQRKHRTSL